MPYAIRVNGSFALATTQFQWQPGQQYHDTFEMELVSGTGVYDETVYNTTVYETAEPPGIQFDPAPFAGLFFPDTGMIGRRWR